MARAIVVRPLLIIADEPADGLEYEEAEVILNTLKEINNENIAIICFSEKKQIIEKVQRHIVFEKGVIKSDSRVKNYSEEEGVV